MKNEHILNVNTINYQRSIEIMNITSSSLFQGYDLIQAVKKPVTYSYAVTITLIVITSILNVCVLCRRALRSSACTYYFLGSVPPVLVYMVVTPLNTIIINSYGFYMSSTQITCKITQYLIYTTSLLYASMLVCASIDRYFSSSASARLRRFSQIRIARRIIIIVWMLILLYMSPFMFIYYYDPNSGNTNKCVQYSTTLIFVYLTTRVILYFVIIPIILCVFGLLTIYNIRVQAHRIAPVNQNNAHRRTEGQLARMLIIQVAVYILFFTPVGIIYFLVTFIPSMNTPYYSTIQLLLTVWKQGGYTISFFFYVLSGKVYRKELRKMFKCDQIRNKILQFNAQRTRTVIPVNVIPNAPVGDA